MIRYNKQQQSFIFLKKKHTFPPLRCMIEGNYLKLHKKAVGGNLYYIDY